MINIEGLIGKIILNTIKERKFDLQDGDILCISSKMCSIAYGNVIDLNTIRPSKLAKQIHKKIPRKSTELIQTILNQTKEDITGKKIMISNSYIEGWLSNGLF